MVKITKSLEKGQRIESKSRYKVINWAEYNKSLINRGDLTLWISPDACSSWYAEEPIQQGAQFKYSDDCIVLLHMLKAVFGLAYRQTEGFARSVLVLMGLDLAVPSYSQICRRAKELAVSLEAPKSRKKLHLVLDSTGLKVYGEGEWKVRKHGYQKRRTWRKLHLAVDEQSGFIHAQSLTENGEGCGDAQQVPDLLAQVESPIGRFSGDGAYDAYEVWSILKQRGIEGLIPPKENAIYWVDEYDQLLDLDRNKILERIEQIGRKAWKIESAYHRRSLSETAMGRYKAIFGSEMYSRKFENQKTEAAIKIKCLNRMTATGMPNSKKMA